MDKIFKVNFGTLTPWADSDIIIIGNSKDEVISYCFDQWGLDNAPYNTVELSMEDDEKGIRRFIMGGGQIIYTDNRHFEDELTFLDMIK